MAIMDNEKMRDYNQQLVMEIVDLFPKSKKVTVIQKSNNVTVKVNGSSATVILYVNENINIFCKVFTVNFQGVASSYCYFDHKDYQNGRKLDLRSYRTRTVKVIRYLISEAVNMTYCPEWRKRMTPSNATKTEFDTYGLYGCWEGRFLEEHNYNDEDKIAEWIDRCTNPKTELERRKLSGE